nr:PREDICTED: anoctamin-9 [Equus przewalskii]
MQGEESLQFLGGTEGDSFPLVEINTCETEASEQWDYVLVADQRTQRNPRQAHQQQRFLEELSRKGFHHKKLQDKEKIFFGIRADSRIFNLYRTLLLEPENPAPGMEPATLTPIPATTRIRIVNFILKSKMAAGDTFEDLVKDGVFETSFPLHKREEDLIKKWAQWRNMFHKQPIDEIRYAPVPPTDAPVPPQTRTCARRAHTSHACTPSKEICEAHDIFMCPRGDHSRKYHRLSDTCTFAKLTHLFDNDGTVLFAIFMAVWATVFLEIWKRQRARVVLHWDLYGWDEDQEEMALQLINCPDYTLQPYQHSYLRSTAILVLSLLMICFLIGMAHVLVVYRVLVTALFSNLPILGEQVTTAVVVTGALVHYVTILIMTKVNKWVALKLCNFEKPRTFSERERKFTIKFFTLQFFVHFSSLIYIAFILGRINGHPGKSVRLAGLWKLEEVSLSWMPHCHVPDLPFLPGLPLHPPEGTWGAAGMGGEELRWLVPPTAQVTPHLPPVIQYGFTTIFVAAFPLAPLLSLLSNLVEIRLDAIKMVRLQKRLVPRKAKDIGTWLKVLETIGVLAVIANGMVIAFTSEFIPRMVYKYRYGPCRWGPRPEVDCLTGYVNHSLSLFYTKDFQDPDGIEDLEDVTECRYRDYRNAGDYNFSEQFWVLLAIRLAFLILFEHVALCIKLIAAWLVPDVPQMVKNKVLDEKYQRLLEKLRSSPRSTDV